MTGAPVSAAMQAPRPPVRPGCASDAEFLRGLRSQLEGRAPAADAPDGAPAGGVDFQGTGGMTGLIAAAESGYAESLQFLVSSANLRVGCGVC